MCVAARAVGVLSGAFVPSGWEPGQEAVGGWLEPVACMCLAAGTSCRCLCGVRGRLQTHTLWWQPEQAARARANDRLVAAV